MDNKKTVSTGGIGLTGLTLLWALITQCLTWAGVISFSWVAIWLPFLISLGLVLAIVLIVLIVAIIAFALDR